jgi:hypothetical protein
VKVFQIGTWISIVLIVAIYVLKNIFFELSDHSEFSVLGNNTTAWGLIVGSVTLVGILLHKGSHKENQKRIVDFLFVFTPFLYAFSILIYLIFLILLNTGDMKILILTSTLLNILFFAYLSSSVRRKSRNLKN